MIHGENSLQDNIDITTLSTIDISLWPDVLNIDTEETAKYFVERFYKSGIIKLTGKVNTGTLELIRKKEKGEILLKIDNPITKAQNTGYLFDEYDMARAQKKVLEFFSLFQDIKKEKKNLKKRIKENRNYLYGPHSGLGTGNMKGRDFNEKNLTEKVNQMIQDNEKDKILIGKSKKTQKKIIDIFETQKLINKGFKKMHREFRKVITIYNGKDFEKKLMNFIKEESIKKEDLSYKGILDNADNLQKCRMNLRFCKRDINVSIYRSIILLLLGNKCCVTGKEGVKYVLSRDKDGGKHLDLLTEDGSILTIDHKIPVSKGGSDDISNLQIMTAELNRKKGNKMDITNVQLKDSQEFGILI